MALWIFQYARRSCSCKNPPILRTLLNIIFCNWKLKKIWSTEKQGVRRRHTSALGSFQRVQSTPLPSSTSSMTRSFKAFRIWKIYSQQAVFNIEWYEALSLWTLDFQSSHCLQMNYANRHIDGTMEPRAHRGPLTRRTFWSPGLQKERYTDITFTCLMLGKSQSRVSEYPSCHRKDATGGEMSIPIY